MDTMSYDEFERMPLFHEKGILPRGKYLFTQGHHVDKVAEGKQEYMQTCIDKQVITVMNVEETFPEDGGLPTINCVLEMYVPDFSDLDRRNAKCGFKQAKKYQPEAKEE